ncbi:patatin-like phospholipase family protein [Burkholderia pseudomallei]|uniref:patatin-like phospholipase family protein n=1 Tax=Burkholderia pseudomallei TaxID=28450 RepID=UPI00168AFFE0|nr:patatin-like phospholipase family protein [Burkholderia pseudomallei]MBD2944623.1 patatin-like phospholipase family protein [Burkholderia pseudomallei]MBD2949820.1 patatin-like phospholipase family protein [Burkholderia pseudomallei]MBD2985894.1 patatin-like phospholipase family protein [Burkholderia pseudomallei]MBD2994069.1 patatin-like phospholipase family protein [Burkholderia pseudomallei]
MSDVHFEKNAIGLAFSGGGVRAAAFHAGVMRYLAEKGLLEDVLHVSSVSGGSLFVGMVFRLADYRWPGSQAYMNDVFPRFREMLTKQSLQWSALARLLLNPFNWRFLLSRANVLAQAIEALWDVRKPLSAIGASPVWSINCTTGETGRRFRFKGVTMGDYELGYADVGDFSLARAMAISAAFPGGIGPLTVKGGAFQWMKRKQWSAGEPEPYQLPFDRLHLYDGGLYDNLGIEPMFDVGSQELKSDGTLRSDITYLLVSDGGAPLARQTIPHPLNPFRFKRIADIALDQSRALRVRAFVNFLQRNPTAGAYVGIGAAAESSIKRFARGREALVAELLTGAWLSSEDAKRAATYSTNLRRLTESSFDLLARHGYETAKWNIEMMSQEQDAAHERQPSKA